jgi:hypothetical protein
MAALGVNPSWPFSATVIACLDDTEFDGTLQYSRAQLLPVVAPRMPTCNPVKPALFAPRL